MVSDLESAEKRPQCTAGVRINRDEDFASVLSCAVALKGLLCRAIPKQLRLRFM